jgi:hypothetical protein
MNPFLFPLRSAVGGLRPRQADDAAEQGLETPSAAAFSFPALGVLADLAVDGYQMPKPKAAPKKAAPAAP